MNKKHDGRYIDMLTLSDESSLTEDYVWATSEESRRHALSLSLIGSIVNKHRGIVRIDPETHSLNIDVPDEEKQACAQELGKKVDMTLH